MNMIRAILVAAALSLGPPAFAQERKPDPVVEFAETDAAMGAAIADARRTYAQFLADFTAAPASLQSNYMVKIGIDASDGRVEHIWVQDLRSEGGRLFGSLANEPVALPGMHFGSPVEIDHGRVSDWAILTAEGLYGSFTTRVMLPHLRPDEAEQMRRLLTPSPLPLDWSS